MLVSGCNRCGEGEGEESPEGPLVRRRPGLWHPHPPCPRQHTSAHTHAHTQAHQTARQLTARQLSPNPRGACSISPPASSSPPNTREGGWPTPHHYVNPNHHPGLPGQAYSPSTEQPPPTKAAKVAAKKLEVNLRLDSAVGEGSSTTPGMHPKTSCWEQRPSRPLHTPVHTGFLLLWFLLGEGEHGGTDIRTENEPEGGRRNL